jgi:hypothetical protein
LDAIHFRQRAIHAREMAQSGDDIRLSRMLLEVALDLDAEAEAIEAEDLSTRCGTKAALCRDISGKDAWRHDIPNELSGSATLSSG